MALVVKDRVKEASTTTGTADFVLGGSAVGFQTFSVIGNGNTTYYAAVDPATGDWEVGVGTYSSVGPTLSRDTVLESSNAGNKVVFGAGSKDIFVTYPAERAVYLDAAGAEVTALNVGTLGADVANITTATITAGTVSTTPTSATDLANKAYVDTMVSSGITYHTPVKYEVPNTTGNLNAVYNQPGGPGVGVGATLTNNGPKAAFAPDGPTAQVGDRVLVYNQTNAFENGVYTVTTVGTPDPGGTNWVLTRATDADSYGVKDPNSLGLGDAFFVTSGNTGAGETYECNTVGVITFGTTPITFVQIASAQVYSAGTGLNLSPATTFNISNTGVVANTYGSASSVPVFAVNAQGQLTSVTNTSISITAGQVSGLAASATTDTTNAANISLGTLNSARLTGSYTGITGVGTLTAGTWNASTIAAIYGGTGLSTYVQGDLLYATSSTTVGRLADVAAGNALISGGVGGDPAWGKIGLQTHVDGTLQVANGGTGATTLTGYVFGNGTGAFTASTSIPNSATTATSANTANAIVARDASGNFSAGTITANLNGNALTATTAANVNNGTLSLGVSGTGLSGSATFTANQSGNSTFTVTSNATSANVADTIVARNASGNFSAGTITASLSGNASSASQVNNAITFNNGGAGGASGSSYNGSGTLTVSYNTVGAPSTTGANASGTWGINISGSAAQLGGYGSSTYVGKFGNVYYQADTWIQCNGIGGLYWPATNAAELNANTTSTYGAIAIIGSRNGWRGIHFQGGGNQPHLMFDGSANGGVYFEGGGRWAAYYNYSNNCWGFGTTSTSSTYNVYVDKGYYAGTRVDSPIFYDANNTGYYVDPNSATQLRTVFADDWFRPQGNTGLYFQSYDYGIWSAHAAGNSYGNVATYNTGRNGWSGYGIGSRWVFMSTGGDNVGIHDNSNGWHYYWDGGSHRFFRGYLEAQGSMRAPIFFDSADTTYYLDPNGYSQINGNGSVNGSVTVGMSIYSTGGNGAIMAFHRGGAFAVNMGLDSDNVFRIGGWSASANRLQLDMSGNLTLAGNVSASSDERLKTNWRDLPANFVERLANVRVGVYDRVDEDGLTQVGVSAQSLQPLLPDAVTHNADGMLGVAYGNAALVSAVKLAEKVLLLEQRIKQLEENS